MRTLLLDRTAWDLVLDASGNIAVASEPYAYGQDAASEIKTFRGECYWDTAIGVPYFTQIFGKRPPPSLLKSLWNAAALRVPGIASVRTLLTGFEDRRVSGQVQVFADVLGEPVAAVDFEVVNPQGAG